MNYFRDPKTACLLIIYAIGFLSSCNTVQDPIFESVENVKIINASVKNVESTLDLVFSNPNSFALDFAQADLIISMDDVELGEVHQTYEAEMPSQSDFKMPIHVNLDLGKLYGDNVLEAMSKGLELMKKRELELRFQGEIYVGHAKTKIKVPIDRVKTIQF